MPTETLSVMFVGNLAEKASCVDGYPSLAVTPYKSEGS